MNQKYDEEFIKSAVDQYNNGQSVALLCADNGVPRSTIYAWVKQHQKLKSSNNTEISYKDYTARITNPNGNSWRAWIIISCSIIQSARMEPWHIRPQKSLKCYIETSIAS